MTKGEIPVHNNDPSWVKYLKLIEINKDEAIGKRKFRISYSSSSRRGEDASKEFPQFGKCFFHSKSLKWKTNSLENTVATFDSLTPCLSISLTFSLSFSPFVTSFSFSLSLSVSHFLFLSLLLLLHSFSLTFFLSLLFLLSTIPSISPTLNLNLDFNFF